MTTTTGALIKATSRLDPWGRDIAAMSRLPLSTLSETLRPYATGDPPQAGMAVDHPEKVIVAHRIAQDAVERAWDDPERWISMSIRNTARSGFFSSDRTVRDYCRDIWHVTPVHVPR